MSNRFLVEYCGTEIYTNDASGNTITVCYMDEGNTITSELAYLTPGNEMTLLTRGKQTAENLCFIPVDGGTGFLRLDCKNKILKDDILLRLISLFPSEPTAYTDLVGTYTSSGTWTAPENGYFQIELYGASGNGGNYRSYAGGGGGGGGCCVISRVKLNQGDTIVYTLGAVGNNSQAAITSTIENETYDTMIAYNATNGTNASSSAGEGGEGGLAANGNYANYNGSDGSDGTQGSSLRPGAGGAGGASGYDGGNDGGNGGTPGGFTGSATDPGTGLPGFMKIYRGNTNI